MTSTLERLCFQSNYSLINSQSTAEADIEGLRQGRSAGPRSHAQNPKQLAWKLVWQLLTSFDKSNHTDPFNRHHPAINRQHQHICELYNQPQTNLQRKRGNHELSIVNEELEERMYIWRGCDTLKWVTRQAPCANSHVKLERPLEQTQTSCGWHFQNQLKIFPWGRLFEHSGLLAKHAERC